MKYFVKTILAISIALYFSGCALEGTPVIGPAKGYVFYDKGNYSDGWRYLEAAPAYAEFTAQWGAYEKDVANTMTAVGFGKQNTQIIVDRLSELGETNCAAQKCVALDINGCKDWFLPSKDELNLMYTNLKKKGLGEFGGHEYWSSSQHISSLQYYDNAYWSAWYKDFYYGGSYNDRSKTNSFSVRAIRAF